MSAVPPQVRAVRALRWNYRWRGVWVWLRCKMDVNANGWIIGVTTKPYHRGWWLVVFRPSTVIAQQMAIAEGVTS